MAPLALGLGYFWRHGTDRDSPIFDILSKVDKEWEGKSTDTVPISGSLSGSFSGSLSGSFAVNIAKENTMKNTYCLFQVKFITEYPNVQHIIITQI
jgi:hypothetical protein